MPIRQAKLASVPDGADPNKIQPSDLTIFTAPGSPQDQDVWAERIAGPPIVYRLKVWDASVSAERVLLEITFPS